MANANPSGPGYAVPHGPRPEQNLLKNEYVVKRSDGVTVKRKVMTNGNVQETAVFASDFPKALTEAEYKAKVEGKGKKNAKGGSDE